MPMRRPTSPDLILLLMRLCVVLGDWGTGVPGGDSSLVSNKDRHRSGKSCQKIVTIYIIKLIFFDRLNVEHLPIMIRRTV